jgi:hypothetical protein
MDTTQTAREKPLNNIRRSRVRDPRPTIEVYAGQLCHVLLIKPLTLPAMWQYGDPAPAQGARHRAKTRALRRRETGRAQPCAGSSCAKLSSCPFGSVR